MDAFASKPFHGKSGGDLSAEEVAGRCDDAKIAAENNLSETAFFVPRGDEYELRWFTPTVEIDLCGHATLASAFILFSELGVQRRQRSAFIHTADL